MSNIVIFEGTNEIIICNLESVAKIVEEWFIDTGRELSDYNQYSVDGSQAIRITNEVTVHNPSSSIDFDVIPVLPLTLRAKLMGK